MVTQPVHRSFHLTRHDQLGPGQVPAPATVRTRFEADVSSPRAARRFTRDALRHWHLDRLDQDAELVVSELVTRAVVAGSGGTLSLHREQDRVRVEVTTDRTDLAPASPAEPGVTVVERVSASWGPVYTWPHYRTTRSELVG